MSLVFADSIKTYTIDQDKAVSPRETVARVRDRLKQVKGEILRDVVRIDKGRLGIPVYMSICGAEAREIVGTIKQMGKGGTPEQAEASALMELMERYSLFSFMNGSFVCSEAGALQGDVVPPEALMQSVHDDPGNAHELEKARGLWSTLPFFWTKAHDLTHNKEVWLPFQWFYMLNEYNGSSAGNTLTEAALQGLCEVVERHVSSVVTNENLPTPAIDLSSVKDPMARELITKYDSKRINLYVKDITLKMGIPTVAALAMDPATFPEKSEIVYTAGTATHPEKALIRALTEIAQLAGDFDTEGRYAESGLPKFSGLEDARYVTEAGNNACIGDMPDVSHSNQRVELEQCARALAEKGLTVYAVDITHPVLRIPAVYMIVPGAHFRERTRDNSFCLHAAKLVSQFPDSQRAVHELERMKMIYPDHYEVHFFLGYTYEREGRYDEALACYERALALDTTGKERASLYCQRGVCYKELGDIRQALAELEKARECNAELKEIHNLMGFCHFKLKDHVQSIACFEKAIDLDPSSAIDYANIGSNLREMGHIAEAIRYYQFALDIDPSIDFARENIEKLSRQALS
ncbi:MAG: YcaO-like family protein [Desulfovibrionales bacterium]|nr:YcaO-like family protein [Desulfovibrionales bacterium]